MNKSEQINELATALAKFQAGMGKVHKSEMHPQFKKPYASITDVIETIQAPLSEVGLSFAQFPDGQALTTILMHASGQWIESSYQLNPVKGDPQGWGSAITYARRYALTAILGLGTEDDDGQTASTPAAKSAPAKQPAPKQEPAPVPVALSPDLPNWKQAVEYLRLNGGQAWTSLKPRYSITPEHEKQLLTESKQAQ